MGGNTTGLDPAPVATAEPLPRISTGDEGRGRTFCNRCSYYMYPAQYYRGQAQRARRLADHVTGGAYDTLRRLAQDFDDIAEDLEIGAGEIRHPELLPQRRPT